MSSAVSFGTETNAQRKRVYYAGDSTIYEGMPVCYDYKATKNVLGYDKGNSTRDDTTAEGYQNEGKFLRVVNPISMSTAGGTFTSATKVLADSEFTGGELPGVGTTVSVASSTDSDIDGNYEVTAVSTGVSITLGGMTDAEAATVTTGISDVTVIHDNIGAFAGVVAHGPKVGKTGPCWLDIFIPNGAVVPVRANNDCLCGRTILAVNTAEQCLTAPHGAARSVAIAMETDATLSTTTGLILAKLDDSMFLFQKNDANSLLVDDTDTDWQRVNSIAIETAGSQWIEPLNVGLDLLAAGTATGIAITGVINAFQTACAGYSTAIQGQVEFESGFVSTGGGARGLGAKIEDKAAVNHTGQTLACLYLEHLINASSTAPTRSSMIQLNATEGTNQPDCFINAQNPDAIAFRSSAPETATKLGDIQLYIVGIGDCYLRVYDGSS